MRCSLEGRLVDQDGKLQPSKLVGPTWRVIQLGNILIGLLKMGGMRHKGFGKTLAFVLMVAFSIVEPGHTNTAQEIDRPNPPAPSLDRIQEGKALYEGLARCIHCHGQTALRRSLTRQELFSIIKFGVPGTSHMPFTYLLSDEQIWAIVEYQLRDACEIGCALDPS